MNTIPPTYDYTAQKWVEGKPALDLRILQTETELRLLTGPDRIRYAFFCGLSEAGRLEAVSKLRETINELKSLLR